MRSSSKREYHALVGIAAELVEALELTVRGQPVSTTDAIREFYRERRIEYEQWRISHGHAGRKVKGCTIGEGKDVKWAHELKENCDYKFLAEIGLSIVYPERLLPSQRFQHTAAEIGEMLRRHRVPDISIYIYIYIWKKGIEIAKERVIVIGNTYCYK